MVNYYECIACNYKTKDRCNIYRHNKTKKHLKNICTTNTSKNSSNLSETSSTKSHRESTVSPPQFTQKISHLCKYCNSTFSRADSLIRHKRICSDKFDEIYKLKQKLSQYEKDVTYQTKETDHYKEEANYYKKMLMEAGGLVKKSVSALTYSIQNFDNAPHIKTIDMHDIKTFENSDKEIVENILSSYKHKTLNKYLGEIILKLYKKEDPLDQSIWNTDDNRLTYLIKKLLSNKSSNWIIDKKGIKTSEYLIDPLLEHIKELIISYHKKIVIPDISKNSIELEIMLENSKKIREIINDIDDGIVAKDVLKYISSHLRFNDKGLK